MSATYHELHARRASVSNESGCCRLHLFGPSGGERDVTLSDEAAWQIVHGLVVYLRMRDATAYPTDEGKSD